MSRLTASSRSLSLSRVRARALSLAPSLSPLLHIAATCRAWAWIVFGVFWLPVERFRYHCHTHAFTKLQTGVWRLDTRSCLSFSDEKHRPMAGGAPVSPPYGSALSGLGLAEVHFITSGDFSAPSRHEALSVTCASKTCLKPCLKPYHLIVSGC